jgi:hypothetical protein
MEPGEAHWGLEGSQEERRQLRMCFAAVVGGSQGEGHLAVRTPPPLAEAAREEVEVVWTASDIVCFLTLTQERGSYGSPMAQKAVAFFSCGI